VFDATTSSPPIHLVNLFHLFVQVPDLCLMPPLQVLTWRYWRMAKAWEHVHTKVPIVVQVANKEG